MENKNTNQGIFINGKGQVIKMFQLLSDSEKERLIEKIKVRNPMLASELLQESYSFDDLQRLSDDNLHSIFTEINAKILGLAIKGSSEAFQRRVLSLAPREYAEEAYETLVSNIRDERIHVERARKKLIDTIISLNKRGLLRL